MYRRPGSRFNRGRVAAVSADFTPASLAGLQLWTYSDDASVSYETGTSSDLRRIDSLPNNGDLGGTLAQSTSASKPVNASFPEGKAAFYDGSNDSLDASAAAANWKFLHDGTGGTVFVVFRTPSVSAANQVLVATSPLTASTGVTLQSRTDGSLRWSIADGVAVEDWSSSISTVQPNTTHIACARHDSSETDIIDVRLDGSQVVSATSYATITPSSSDPSNPFKVGRQPGGAGPFSGWIPEVIAYNRYLTDAECAQVEAYLSRWTCEVSYDDLATASVASLYSLVAFFHSNGSAWVDRLGTYTPTEVGTPTHAADANFGGSPTVDLNGTTQSIRVDALAPIANGEDTPISIICAARSDVATAVERQLWSFGATSANQLVRTLNSGVPNMAIGRWDGVSNLTQSGAAQDTNAHIFSYVQDGTTARFYIDATESINASLNVGSLTLGQFTIGARRWNGNNDALWNGQVATLLASTRRLNRGDVTAIYYALATEFGL